MRDPERIEPVLEAIREQWAAAPDLRLGQLLWQAMNEVLPEGTMPREVWPLCQIEEPRLMEGLARRAEKLR